MNCLYCDDPLRQPNRATRRTFIACQRLIRLTACDDCFAEILDDLDSFDQLMTTNERN